jgi:hypothetical protein
VVDAVAGTVMDGAVLVLAQASGDWGQSGSPMQNIWAPIIAVLKGLLVAAAGLGLTVGVIYKLMDDDDSGKHSWTNKVMGASAFGLFLGLLAEPIVSKFVELI